MTKTILITGSAIRVGKELAIFLAKENYNIAIHYNTSNEEAIKTQNLILDLNVKCKIYQGNLLEPSNCYKLINQVFDDFDDLFCLINNASMFYSSNFLESDYNQLYENFQLNMFAPYLLIQSFAKSIKHGKIINITDIRVDNESLKFLPYILSKKSLADLTQLSAKSLAPNIEVNEIRPTIIFENNQYDPIESENILTKRKDIKEFFSIVDNILNNQYYGKIFEI